MNRQQAELKAVSIVEDNTRVLKADFAEWTTLKAWGCYLGAVDVVHKPRPQNLGCHGHYNPMRNRITMFVGCNVHKCRAVLLHEMAHAAFEKLGYVEKSRRTHHGPQWRELYAAAAREVLGNWDFMDKNNLSLTSKVSEVFALLVEP